MRLVLDRRYPIRFSGIANVSTVKVATMTLPWLEDQTAEQIASSTESACMSKGLTVLRTRVWIDWVWMPPHYEVTVECTTTIAGRPGVALWEPISLATIAAILLALAAIGIVIAFVVSQMSKDQPFQNFPCPECGLIFTTSSAYDAHMKSVHGVERYTCPYCGAGFDTSAELERHVREAHRGGFDIGTIVTVLVVAIIAMGAVLVLPRALSKGRGE